MPALSPATRARFEQLAARYPDRRSAIVPMLLFAQDETEARCLSPELIREIAGILGQTELAVREVIGYYSMLRTLPAGRYHVQVCTNISCLLRGGEETLAHCQRRLGIRPGQTTPDGLFSLEEVECIGACAWAPALQVNYDFHQDLDAAKVDEILEHYRRQG